MIRLSKILAINVIILLIVISVISSAYDININNDDELIENLEVEQLDDEIEIISYIEGIAFWVDKTGFIFNKQISITPYKTAILIIGIRIPSSYLFDMFFLIYPNCIIRVSHFFGRVNDDHKPPYIRGFAIGNIEFLQ